jgi:hypothetical protein
LFLVTVDFCYFTDRKAERAMTDETPKQGAEAILTRTPAFSTAAASNFAKMRENAFKRNKALLKVRSDAKSTKTE